MIVYVGHRLAGREAGYFGTTNSLEEWTIGGQTVPMSFWHRPLHAMTDAFTAAGFRLSVISERQPVPAARELFPEEFRSLSATPSFLFFVLEAG